MRKYFAFIAVFFLFSASAVAQYPTYVRKMIEPDFFIPQSDKFYKPEKLPPVVYKKPMVSEEENAENNSDVEEWSEPSKVEPPYRKEYEKYHQELVNMENTGKLYRNTELDDTLAQMQSGKVFEVKNKPSQNSEVNTRFEKALQQTLQEN